MAVKRATLEIESTGQIAEYLAEGEEVAPGEIHGATTLTIEVQDFEEALEIVETLNRSRAQKKRERKVPEPPPPAEPEPKDLHLASGKTGTASREALHRRRRVRGLRRVRARAHDRERDPGDEQNRPRAPGVGGAQGIRRAIELARAQGSEDTPL